jgi:hypothetical protein
VDGIKKASVDEEVKVENVAAANKERADEGGVKRETEGDEGVGGGGGGNAME